MNSSFAARTVQAARDLAEALSITQPNAPPPGAPPPGAPPPGAPPPGAPPPGAPPPGAPTLQSGLPQNGATGPSPEPPSSAANPLQGLPSFKSPPLASYLQKATGAQGPVGFAKGGYVKSPLAVYI